MEEKKRVWPARLIGVCVVLLMVFFGCRAYYRLTDDFRLANITYSMPYNAEWETKDLPPDKAVQMHAILSRPFTYVGKGAQSYVFMSEDGNYVIKFFKFKHLKPNPWMSYLPQFSFIQEYAAKRAARKERLLRSVFAGYLLTYQRHKEETGLVYLHLLPTSDWNVVVTLYDKIGREHRFDLSSVVFVIQESAHTTRSVIAEALDKGDIVLAKKRIGQILDLYLTEYSKGFYDRDHGVMQNTGFVGEKPIHLDVGKVSAEPRMAQGDYYQADFELVARKLDVWFKEHYPQHHAEMRAYLEQRLTAQFGRNFEV